MTDKLSFKSYECRDDVPYHWVQANQIGILLCIIIAVALQWPWILAAALVVQLISRANGIKYNVFVRLIAPWLPVSSKTESRELLRFNNLLAILFLAGSLICFAIGATLAGYIIVGMLATCVILALSGFCLGCFIYFQWKQFWTRRRLSSKH